MENERLYYFTRGAVWGTAFGTLFGTLATTGIIFGGAYIYAKRVNPGPQDPAREELPEAQPMEERPLTAVDEVPETVHIINMSNVS